MGKIKFYQIEIRNKNEDSGYNKDMKKSLILFVLVLFSACAMQKVESQKLVENEQQLKIEKASKQRILVELFTSEGCYSCPPAERLLAKLDKEQPFEDAELITLAFHVDYWDYLGWKDKYASPLFSQRQRVYDRKFRTGKIYTPQMIVDGDIEFVGSRKKSAEKAIKKSVKNEKATVKLKLNKDKLIVKISELPEHKDATVYLAIAEDNLSTDIKRGENAGKNLTHLSVVRSLNALGRIMPNDKSFEAKKNLQIQKDWKKKNLKLVVFIQENRSRKVIGLNRISMESEFKS